MKNTKMRKKMLVSSIAMLMVATVSLGSATYAWFTQSPNASAKGLSMKATSANGLKIMTESRSKDSNSNTNKTDYLSEDYLNYAYDETNSKAGTSSTAFTLDPVSMKVAVDDTLANVVAYKTTAEEDNDATGYVGAVVNKSGSASYNTGDYYEEDIYCKLVGVADTNAKATLKVSNIDVKFNQTYNALAPAVRLLVSYKGTVKGVYAANAIDSGLQAIEATSEPVNGAAQDATDPVGTYPISDGNSYYGNATMAAQTFGGWDLITASNALELGDVGIAGTDAVTVTIYLDGEDSACYAKNIQLADLISEVKVDLTIA